MTVRILTLINDNIMNVYVKYIQGCLSIGKIKRHFSYTPTNIVFKGTAFCSSGTAANNIAPYP